MRYIALYLLAVVFLFSSCGDTEGPTNELEIGKESDTTHASTELSAELIMEVIKSIPSPLEMASMLKEVGSKYSSDLLNSTSNAANYTTNAKRAMNLGIYGADLGYINIYNQKQDAINYLNSITSIAEELKVGQFFDVSTLKRMATNSTNLDSLLYISTNNFEKMNNYLQEQKRGNLSTFMLTGGWIEALYIVSEVAKGNNNKQLFEKIGEQKIVLDQILLLLNFYKGDPQVAALISDFDDLKKIYDRVAIVHVYKEPTVEEVNGIMMVTDNSTTTINVTKEQIAEIANKTKQIRSKIVN